MVKVSIIVPVYKVEQYIDNCIKSLLSQTLIEIEIILVDDGSPDNSGEICDAYQKIDNRIKVIHQENGGLSKARNSGLKIANGEYIVFVDSDDWIKNTMCEKLYNAAQEDNAEIAICKIINAINEQQYDQTNDTCNKEILTNVEAVNQLYDGTNHVEMVVAWNKIYKKELFDDIEFANGKIHEDEFTTYKLLYKANKVVKINKYLY